MYIAALVMAIVAVSLSAAAAGLAVVSFVSGKIKYFKAF
jgi:hypothetical protein